MFVFLAQLVEHITFNDRVTSSSLVEDTLTLNCNIMCLYSKTPEPIKTNKPLIGYKWGYITCFNYYESPIMKLCFPFNKVLKDIKEENNKVFYHAGICKKLTIITSGYFHFSNKLVYTNSHFYKVIIPKGTLMYNHYNEYESCAKHIIIVNPDIIRWYQRINIYLYEKGIFTAEWADFAAKLYAIHFKFKLPILLLGNKLSRLKSKIKKLNNF